VRSNYRELIHILKKRYGIKDPPSTVRKSLQGIRQLETEPIEEFADRIYDKITNGYPEANDEMIQSIAVDHFLTGCKDRQAALIANLIPPRTISQALKKVKEQIHSLRTYQSSKSLVRHVMFEDEYMVDEVRPGNNRRSYSPSLPPTPQREATLATDPKLGTTKSTESTVSTPGSPSFREDLQRLIGETLRRSIQGELRKLREQSPSRYPMSPPRGCFKCGKTGHFKRDCPELVGDSPTQKNEMGLDKPSRV
jgi:hypothetical protein